MFLRIQVFLHDFRNTFSVYRPEIYRLAIYRLATHRPAKYRLQGTAMYRLEIPRPERCRLSLYWPEPGLQHTYPEMVKASDFHNGEKAANYTPLRDGG